MMDSVGHYSRPELLSLLIDRGVKETSVERRTSSKSNVEPAALALDAHQNEERFDAVR
jgi:hypothetical protein